MGDGSPAGTALRLGLDGTRHPCCRLRADGGGRLADLDAYGLGPLQPGPDGHELIFSRVDNSWALWRHQPSDVDFYPRSPGWDRYYPKVAIARLDRDGRVATLAQDAGLPAVEPGL